MKLKKKDKINAVEVSPEKIDAGSEELIEDSSLEKAIDANSIEEFIEIKKLQNRLLEKMIKKINDSEN